MDEIFTWRLRLLAQPRALLTGRLPVRSGLYGNAIRVFFPDEPGGFPDTEVTLAEALKEHGYATGMFGKWHLGDAPHALPTRHGFDEWVGVPYSNDMNWVGEPDFEALVKLNMSGDLEQRAAIYARRAAICRSEKSNLLRRCFSAR